MVYLQIPQIRDVVNYINNTGFTYIHLNSLHIQLFVVIYLLCLYITKTPSIWKKLIQFLVTQIKKTKTNQTKMYMLKLLRLLLTYNITRTQLKNLSILVSFYTQHYKKLKLTFSKKFTLTYLINTNLYKRFNFNFIKKIKYNYLNVYLLYKPVSYINNSTKVFNFSKLVIRKSKFFTKTKFSFIRQECKNIVHLVLLLNIIFLFIVFSKVMKWSFLSHSLIPGMVIFIIYKSSVLLKTSNIFYFYKNIIFRKKLNVKICISKLYFF